MQTALLKLAAKLRRERTVTPERMASQREEFREEYIKLLGIDTCREVFGVGAPEAERTAVGNDEFCKIERMALKLCDGVTFTGLLLTPHRRAARTPFVIMSHGGFYTLYTMTCDVRLKSGWSAAFFNDRTKYCRRDFVWMDSAGRFLDAEVAGLCAPRRLWIDVGSEDTVFSADGVEEHFERAESFFAACGASKQLKTELWKGGHRFSDSNESSASNAFDFFLEGMGVFV